MFLYALLIVVIVVVFLAYLELRTQRRRKLSAVKPVRVPAPLPVVKAASTAHQLIAEVENEMGKLQNVPSQSITLIAAKLAALRATVI